MNRCSPSGDSVGDPTPPDAPSPQVERQAIENLVQLYGQAVAQEDIDRLQALLAPEVLATTAQASQRATTRQASDASFADLDAFRAYLRATFRSLTVIAVTIPPDRIEIASDLSSATFLEVESTTDSGRLLQQSRVYRTTFHLLRTQSGNIISFHIDRVTRQGPLVQISTAGQMQAGGLARVTVSDPSHLFGLSRATIRTAVSGAAVTLRTSGDVWTGVVSIPSDSATVQVDLQGGSGEALSVTHMLQMRQAGDKTVQPIAGATGIALRAVAVTGDGSVWAGGETGASLYRLAPGRTEAERVGQLVSDSTGRVEDLLEDSRGRLQAVVFGQQSSGVVVYDQGILCQTVNVVDPSYPFQTTDGQPGASTRAIAADSGAIWLHGSDDGIARVSDALPAGQCPDGAVSVTYAPVMRRQDGQLPANTVPALLAQADGSLWIGSALGLARLQDGQVTRMPFDAKLSFQGNPETLEAFFAAVARAIAAAQPVDSVAIGGVSFIDAFGSPLIKEDLIFSLDQDSQGRLWVGTFGGGVRRVEQIDGDYQDTLHLTRDDGLAGNVVFALAVAPDDTVWVATDDGVSQIREIDGALRITNYTAIDGLTLPARDLAVDASGAAWVATDGGLYRIAAQGGEIAGVVRDINGQPVAHADVTLFGTPFHTLTDTNGQFILSHLPAGMQQLLVDGRLAGGGPFVLAAQQVDVTDSRQTLAPLRVATGSPIVSIDLASGGDVTFPLLPGSALIMPPQDGANGPIALNLTALDTSRLPAPLPAGFTAVAAAGLQPDGATFDPPVTLTLPNHAQLPPGKLLILMRFNDEAQTYEQVGLGRVSLDGSVIDTLSGGLNGFSTVVFAATARDATKVFLLPVSGNNQQVQAGQDVLPEPLVVRLEDQFGNPVVGETVTATIIRGDWTIVDADLKTDAQGEARFEAQTGGTGSGADFVAQITTPELAGVRPVQFLAIVGDLDTPGFADDVAVAGGVAYVADGQENDLLVIDLHDGMQPELLHTITLKRDRSLGEGPRSVAVHGSRLYVGAVYPDRLYIIDISNPRAADFAADHDGDGLADVILSMQDFSGDVQGHFIKDIVVQGERVYAISNTLNSGPATLYVVDVQDSTMPRLLSATPLPSADPTGVAVVGDVVYVAAEATGLLVFDVHDPTTPRLVTTLGDPEPDDGIDVFLSSRIVRAGNFAYVVQTHRDGITKQLTDRLVVFDVRTPEAPQRRGSALLTTRPQLPLFSTGLAVADSFAYVVRGTFGLEALDVRDPDAPRRVGFVDTPSEALQVTTEDAFIYVTDVIFGLQVIQGPGTTQTDTDGDGIVDFFDVFPTDPTESQDSDGDLIGDNADPDDDNDGFTDVEEAAATPPTNPADPLSFPVRVPPPGVTTVLVDAATSLTARERQGTPEAPYRSVTEALQALHSGLAPDVHTVRVRPGIYSPLTTQETIPLELSQLSHLTLQAEEPGTVVIDGNFRGDVISAEFCDDLVIEGLVVSHGANGVSVRESSHVTIRDNEVRGHSREGIEISLNSNTGIVVTGNVTEDNGLRGILIAGNSAATVTQNAVHSNGESGIYVELGSNAEIIGNVSTHSVFMGILVSNSTVTIAENILEYNLTGIVIFGDATATVTRNIARFNNDNGIIIDVNSTAVLRDNTVVGNGFVGNPYGTPSGRGVSVEGGSMATISGGIIAENATHGINVRRSPFQPDSAVARIGIDSDASIEISDNGGAGIFVADDGSEATIDSRNIEFCCNAEGDTVGNVIDVAP